MDKSTGSPSRAHMALLYGPRTEQELDAAIGPFIRLRDEYRRRFTEDGIALTHEEAVDAYRLMAPLYAPDMTDEEAARVAAMNAIAFPCSETGAYGFRGPAVKAILEGFERAIAEGSQTLHIRHDGEAEAREVDSWTRFILYQALKLFVDVQDAHLRAGISIVGEIRADLDRARAILAKLTVTRPRGRYDARLTLRRNTYIVIMLCELADCGLPIASLAGALAKALNDAVSESTIAKVWEAAPQRNGSLPAELRLPESLTRRTRERFPDAPDGAKCGVAFAPDVQCGRCGNAGKVPTERLAAFGMRAVCVDCRPPHASSE